VEWMHVAQERQVAGSCEHGNEPSLCLTKYHAMKTYWGVEVQYHAFLTSALDGGW
jgi:hypothetical protein